MMKKETIKILILTANPKGTDPLSLGVEVRRIEEALARARNRDRFEVITRSAVRTIDLRRALIDHRPQIVHFSGHGAQTHGLVLENDAGKMQLVSTEALAGLFGAFEVVQIECVLLNACYSEVQAEAIHQFVDCVIGMNQPIGDKAAIQFAEGFYDALGAGSSYEEAYKVGCSAIHLDGSSEYSTPVIKNRKRATISQKNDSLPASSTTSIEELPNKNSQSYSIADVSIGSGDNAISFSQGNNNSVQLSKNTSQDSVQNTDLQAALDALAKLKQEIAATDALNPMQKRMMVELPIKTIEAELPKSPLNKQSIGQAVEALKQGLEGIPILAEPVAKVALLVEKAGVS
jgi:hypothetical protein